MKMIEFVGLVCRYEKLLETTECGMALIYSVDISQPMICLLLLNFYRRERNTESNSFWKGCT